MSPASLWVLAFLAGAGFDPGTLKDVAGPPNEVMVLGTPHLSNWPESFEAKQLDPLLFLHKLGRVGDVQGIQNRVLSVQIVSLVQDRDYRGRAQ